MSSWLTILLVGAVMSGVFGLIIPGNKSVSIGAGTFFSLLGSAVFYYLSWKVLGNAYGLTGILACVVGSVVGSVIYRLVTPEEG